VDQHGSAGIGQDVPQFRGLVPVVHVDGDSVNFQGGEDGHQIERVIVHADGHPGAGPYSAPGKECREPRRLVVELTPAEDRIPVHDRGVSVEEGGAALERGGNRGIGAHAATVSG
jgi:hypothetical protein